MHQVKVGWLVLSGCASLWPNLAGAQFAIGQSVENELLAAGAVVEFVVTVENAGPAVAAPGPVTVTYSAGLEVPAGTTPFPSQGSYDPLLGLWEIGNLQPGAQALLVLPAQVQDGPLPPCVFSRAVLPPAVAQAGDPGQLAFATLRAPGVEACADLFIDRADPGARTFPFCEGEVYMWLPIANRGPDPAREVFVSVSQQPNILPGLVFRDGRCANFGEVSCLLTTMAPGEEWRLLLESAVFKNKTRAELVLGATVSSAVIELDPGQESSSAALSISPYEPCPEIKVDFDSGSIGACFIATAAWGSTLDPHVRSLRRFRDRFLLTNGPGRSLVALYYRLSPPLADYISTRPVARALTRALLWPLVFVVEHPVSLLWLAAGGLWLARRRRSGGTRVSA
ncbi:MAG TPA: DUF11 domain-containing protein [Gammaproteobacteria bacterium]|nr:DUF11 domain-containing protein [Gammaproteobacteria bacterium]